VRSRSCRMAAEAVAAAEAVEEEVVAVAVAARTGTP